MLAASGNLGAALAWLVSFKPVLLGILFILLLLSNWLVKYEFKPASPEPKQEQPEKPRTPEAKPNTNSVIEKELDRLHGCFALQEKILERLVLSEMKLKVLESQMFIVWNRMNYPKKAVRRRNYLQGKHGLRRHDSIFSILSECTSISRE